MSRAVLSIGSNLGERLDHLRSVLRAAGRSVVAVSAVYETAPWGLLEQDDFLNAVLVLDDPGRDAAGWLEFARACERDAGRTRELHWGPRTLDVDILDVDGTTSADPELTLPHPRAAQRAFVLVPWLDADPDARLAGVPVRHLVDAMDPAELAGVRLVSGVWCSDTDRHSQG